MVIMTEAADTLPSKDAYAWYMDESKIRDRVRELRDEIDSIKRYNAEYVSSPSRNQAAKQANENRRMRLEQIAQELGVLSHRNLQ